MPSLADRLARDNMRLAWYVVHQLSGAIADHGLDLDEAYSAALVGLAEAAVRFDPGRGTAFSTYAVPMIRGHVLRLMRQVRGRHRSRPVLPLRLDDVFPWAEHMTWADVIGQTDEQFAVADLRAEISLLPERVREVVKRRIAGESEMEIGRALGVSQGTVSRLLKEAVRRLRGGEERRGFMRHAEALERVVVALPTPDELRKAEEDRLARRIAEEAGPVKIYRLSPEELQRVKEAYGMARGYKHPDDVREEARKLYAQGKAPERIDAELGIGKGTTRSWASKYGWDVRKTAEAEAAEVKVDVPVLADGDDGRRGGADAATGEAYATESVGPTSTGPTSTTSTKTWSAVAYPPVAVLALDRRTALKIVKLCAAVEALDGDNSLPPEAAQLAEIVGPIAERVLLGEEAAP
jgi:RNA polymerase sigma factor (sigma-70 family)